MGAQGARLGVARRSSVEFACVALGLPATSTASPEIADGRVHLGQQQRQSFAGPDVEVAPATEVFASDATTPVILPHSLRRRRAELNVINRRLPSTPLTPRRCGADRKPCVCSPHPRLSARYRWGTVRQGRGHVGQHDRDRDGDVH